MNKQIMCLLSSVTLILFIDGCDEKVGALVYSNSTTYVEFIYSDAQQKLSLAHKNAGFNCCPGDPYCEISLSNDTITISEFEEISGCDCNCLYDMSIDVKGLDKDIYFVRFVEPHRCNQQEIIFEINLLQDSTGSQCFERTQYPWGM